MKSASDFLYPVIITSLIEPKAPMHFWSVAIDQNRGLKFDLVMLSLWIPIEISRNFDMLNKILVLIIIYIVRDSFIAIRQFDLIFLLVFTHSYPVLSKTPMILANTYSKSMWLMRHSYHKVPTKSGFST